MTTAKHLTLDELLQAVELVDAHLDSSASPDYQAQPLAQDWARITKPCEEAGEVWKELSRLTGENVRKGKCGSRAELLAELGDTASAAICAIQHITKDTDAAWAVVSAALIKARTRVALSGPCHCGRPRDEHWTPGTAELRCPEGVATHA
jgi:hypothetical protein